MQMAQEDLRPRLQQLHMKKCKAESLPAPELEEARSHSGAVLAGVDQCQMAASFEFEGASFEAFVADVAARIIQSYWHRYKEMHRVQDKHSTVAKNRVFLLIG